MKKRKLILVVICIFVMISLGSVTFMYGIPSIPKMFKMNKQLQEEGYYMIEFEFKLLGIVYNLDRGRYVHAYKQLTKYNKQMKTREGLIKLPKFADKKEELEFYLNLQNPNTGAFMDDSYPFCTYTGPTGNVLIHLASLAEETGQPLKLKYPLRYLDQINTPEKLRKYLDDVSTVGWLGNKFPQTSFHFARCLLSLAHEDNTIGKYHLYELTPEWRTAILQWFYEHQDSTTGVWGPRSKSGKLRRIDTMNTGSILKAFVDEDGNNIHKEFPLRYKDQLGKTILAVSFGPIPKDADLDDWHEWNLNTSKSLRMLIRWLWADLSKENKAKTKEEIKKYIRVKYEKFYIAKEGSFSYYPGSEHGTLDGSQGIIGTYKEIGAFSGEKQLKLWGKTEVNYPNSGSYLVSEITEADLSSKIDLKQYNSLRVYTTEPEAGNYTANVLGVFYPQKPIMLDVMDLIPKMKTWIDTTSQSLGNWTSREDILQSLVSTDIKAVPVYQGIPLKELNELLKESKKVVIIGFDELQIPKAVIRYQGSNY